jgi:hypothetical protein
MPGYGKNSRKTAMIQVRIDTANISAELHQKFRSVIDPKSGIFRQLATELVPVIQERIHVEGKAADGTQIGTYSNAYLKLRSGAYGNAARYSKGKNAGKLKNAGTTTKGKNAGGLRQRFNRSSDPKVILSLTRQMENDYTVLATDRGWGIGFVNSHNADKARWNDKRYGHVVYDLTKDELNK